MTTNLTTKRPYTTPLRLRLGVPDPQDAVADRGAQPSLGSIRRRLGRSPDEIDNSRSPPAWRRLRERDVTPGMRLAGWRETRVTHLRPQDYPTGVLAKRLETT